MNPIATTQRDSTQSGMDDALSSGPHVLTGSVRNPRVDFSKDCLSRETRAQRKQGGPNATHPTAHPRVYFWYLK